MIRVIRIILGVVLAAVMIVSTSCSSEQMNYQYFRVYIDGQPTLGLSMKKEDPTGLIIFFHGQDDNEFSLTRDDDHKKLTDTLVGNAFAVIASEADGNAYGNQESQRIYRRLIKTAISHYKAKHVILLAESMGAVAAVNILATSPDLPILGLAAISPALDFNAAPSEYRAKIHQAYPDTSPESTNPMNIPPELLAGKKIRFYVTQQDSTVSTDANALAFRDRFGSAADISIITCTGGHLDASCIQGEDLVRWFRSL
jgi:pimeloyl-ACP methyl ester carboxylesterase